MLDVEALNSRQSTRGPRLTLPIQRMVEEIGPERLVLVLLASKARDELGMESRRAVAWAYDELNRRAREYG